MLRIGELRHRLALEAVTRVADGAGGFTETVAALTPSPVWASIQPASARDIERVFGAKVQTPITHLVTIRFHTGVLPTTRAVFGTRTLHIRGMQNVGERNRWLVLACEELATT